MIWAGPVRAAAPALVTVISFSSSAAGVSVKSTIRRWPSARKVESRRSGVNPIAETSIRYGPPTDRYSMKYRPRALVVVCHRSPVDVLVTWTMACSTGVLSRSSTRPSIAAPVTPCAASGGVAQSSDTARPRTASAVPVLECCEDMLERGSAMCPLGRLELLESAEEFGPAPGADETVVPIQREACHRGFCSMTASGPALGVHSVARSSPFALVLTPTIWPNSFSSSASPPAPPSVGRGCIPPPGIHRNG